MKVSHFKKSLWLVIMCLCIYAYAADAAKPLKVYILVGQSNMEGKGDIKTFDYIGDDPATATMLKEMRGPDGKPRICEKVWISYFTGWETFGEGFGKLTAGYGSRVKPAEDAGKIGPEFTFGIYMSKAYEGPILIIKTAWGGKSLNTDFRSPSGGPYKLSNYQLDWYPKRDKITVEEVKARKAEATGKYYRVMVSHVKKVLGDIKRVYPAYDPEQGYELAGFVWFQGWNDMCDGHTYPDMNKPGGYDLYSELLAHFIRDVRKDLSAPKMPFVIGVMGFGGSIEQFFLPQYKEQHRHFRAAMAAPAAMDEFKGNVVAIPTSPYWDTDLAAIDRKIVKVNDMARFLQTKHKKHANKDGTMTSQEQKAYLDKYRSELITPEEESLWKRGASSGGSGHYFGSAKFHAQIGKAFAEAMLEMDKK